MHVCPKPVIRRVRKGSESVEKLHKFYSKISLLREISIKNGFTRAMVRRIPQQVITFHKKSQVLFWPNLESAYYANICQGILNKNDIKFIPKTQNPPNLPQARPIENFCSISKQQYIRRFEIAKSLRVSKGSAKISVISWQKVMDKA